MDSIASYLAFLIDRTDVLTVIMATAAGVIMTCLAILLLFAVRPKEIDKDTYWPSTKHWFPSMLLIGWPSSSVVVISRWIFDATAEPSGWAVATHLFLCVGIVFLVVEAVAFATRASSTSEKSSTES
jgi:hypothetical protein